MALPKGKVSKARGRSRRANWKLTLPAIVMKTADDRFCVGWLASQTDMLADDWKIVE